jgi:hypothetical protein
MSHGALFGYPAGIAMYNDDQHSYMLEPDMYTINEYFEVGWNLVIDIDDPSGGSYPSGRTAVINLTPGETVEVTFSNTYIPH